MHQEILVIDDSPQISVLVTALLAGEQINVHTARDAAFGLTLAASIKPDLILLDVDMPGINGFEACRTLKANPQTDSIPIVFLSGASSVEDKVKGLGLGALDYIAKPFSRPELLARVRASLRTSRMMKLLEQKARIDFLTGLGNRAMFDDRFAAETSLRVRTATPLSTILIDADSFKSINDRFGHPFGDQVLCKLAATIAERCRAEDVACRFGGDEFIVLTPNTTARDATLLAGRMRSAVSQLSFDQDGESIKVTCSLGVAEATDVYDRTIVDRADSALYQSKLAGRNRVSTAVTQCALRMAA